MSSIDSIHQYNYLGDGTCLSPQTISVDQLDLQIVAEFRRKLSRLSGDLELPLEAKLPGNLPHLEYRIGSDGAGAYVLYYFHDEVISASLILPGQSEEQESELMQVFRFLLLDDADAEEPSEEEIDEVLSSDEFDFEQFSDRPAIFTIHFSIKPGEQQEQVLSMNQHLATAFFQMRLE